MTRSPTQLTLALGEVQRFQPVTHLPDGLLQALAELLLGALDATAVPKREMCDEPEDHA